MLPRYLLSAAALFFIFINARAQIRWEYLGSPASAQIMSLARDAQGNLYAAVSGGASYDRFPQGQGLYRSTDDGVSWSLAAFHGEHVQQVAVAPDNTIYTFILSHTGQDGDLVGMSRDGIHWSAQPLGRVHIQRVITEGSSVHMLMRDWGVLTSFNSKPPHGNAWASTRGATTMAISPTGALITGCDSCRTIIISDSGRAWTEGSLNGVRWLAHDGGSTFYALGRSTFSYSTDDGERWKNLPAAPAAMKTFIADQHFGLLGVGAEGEIYRSRDRGRRWTRIKGIDAEISDAIFTRNGDIIVGTRTKGLFRQTQSGDWMPVGHEIRAAQLTSIAMAPDGSLLLGAEGGIYRSTDGGRTWSGRDRQLPFWTWREIPRVAGGFHVRPNGSIIVPFGHYVLRSTDNGASWKIESRLRVNVENGPYGVDVHDGAVYVGIPGMTVGPDGKYYVATHLTPLYVYDENRIGWRVMRVNAESVYDRNGFEAVFVKGDRIYLVKQWRTLLSRDRGRTWKSLPRVPENTYMQTSALVDDGSLLTANYCGRLYRLPKDGAAWERIGILPLPIDTIIPIRGDTLVALATGRIVRSINGGRSWASAGEGLENEYVADITLAPDGRLYAATGSGVYACSAGSVFAPSRTDTIDMHPRFEVHADSISAIFRLPFNSATLLSANKGSDKSPNWELAHLNAVADTLNRVTMSLRGFYPGNYTVRFVVGCTLIDSVAFTVPERTRK